MLLATYYAPNYAGILVYNLVDIDPSKRQF